MRQIILAIFIFTCTLSSQSQTKDLNLGFEKIENGLPAGWESFGDSGYLVSVDSNMVKTGHYSATITSNGSKGGFRAWSLALPNYKGNTITLTGYVRAENVSNGYAGLWMRIDPNVALDNMDNRGISGTTGWQKLEITLQLQPDRTSRIVVGGLLAGKGKVWLDDLQVTVDTKDIAALQPYQRKILPAELDKEFDNGSGITNIPSDKGTIEKLKILGLVWGFLKYYHPSVAGGNYNWDYALFRVVPKILASKNNSERDAVLSEWIKGLGNFKEGTAVKFDPGKTKIEPDLGWINNAGLSPELVSQLSSIKTASRSNEHYYIGLQPDAKNPDIKNENAYTAMKFPDAGFRLLALYRYWNIIQYFFPYKHLIKEDWKNVLEEFIPKFISNTDETSYDLTMLELIARIHDTHANIWGGASALEDYWGRNYAAVELSFAEDKAVVTGFYEDSLGRETGLEIGDVITSINGQSVETIVKNQLKLTPASNYPTQLRVIADRLLRTNDPTIHIEISRQGNKASKTIAAYAKTFNRYRRFYPSDTCLKLIGDTIAYLNNGTLKKTYLPRLWPEIQKTKALIIDDRNYPSDFVIYDLGSFLLPEPTPFVRFTQGSITTPGLFTMGESLTVGVKNHNAYQGTVVILVNERSQSSAEFHAMAYRVFPNAVVIGSTTAGADGNVSQIILPGGISTMISGIGVYYPDGRETQRVGIVPDIEVKPTVEGIRQGRDEVLEKARKVIEEKTKGRTF